MDRSRHRGGRCHRRPRQPEANVSFVAKFVISGGVTTGAGSVLNSAILGHGPANIQEIDVTGTVTGPGSVTARGAAGSLYTLADPEYAGNTTVNSGTLSLGADNSSNNASTVTIAATGATLDLNFAGIETVDKLFIGGVQQNAGDYTSAMLPMSSPVAAHSASPAIRPATPPGKPPMARPAKPSPRTMTTMAWTTDRILHGPIRQRLHRHSVPRFLQPHQLDHGR